MFRNIIFHIDVNSAFLSWEAVYRLAHKGGQQDLREIASAVGGDMAMRHGIILAKSIPAKKYGIQTGETILEARRKCPGLVLVPPNYSLYEKCSAAFMDILRKRYGMDSVMRAAFLKQPIDHISGGISDAKNLRREKRTADYDKVAVE